MTAESTEKQRRDARFAGIGCIALVIAAVLLLYDCSASGSDHSEELARPRVKISAIDLQQQFSENEVRAENLFEHRNLEVTGDVLTISDTGVLQDGDALVTLAGDEGGVRANFRRRDDAAKLTSGQTVTLHCVGAIQSLGSLTLNDCVLASINDAAAK